MMLKKFFQYTVIVLITVSCLSKSNTSKLSSAVVDTVNVSQPIKKVIPSYVPKAAPYQAANTKVTDLIHTKLQVAFDWEKQYLYGTANLLLKPYFYSQNSVILDAKGFDIEYVKLKNEKGVSDLKFDYDSLQLIIYLDKDYTRYEEYELEIKYTAKPNELKEGGSKAIKSDKGLYFINPLGEDPDKPKQIWTQGETQASSCWFPTIDSPNEKTTQEIYITVDSIYTALSNGELVYKRENEGGTYTYYWRQTKPHAPYLFMMAVGEFAKIEDSWKELEVNYYVEKEYEQYAKGVFGNTPEMMTFFSEKLGYEYPWDKYSQVVVRDYVSGAMENTSTALFLEGLQIDHREQIDKNWDFIIAHELFHHWFGDLVTCESWSNLPLNESFANYSEYLWTEYKYGKEEADLNAEKEFIGYLKESGRKQVPLIRYHYRHREDMFDAHSYNKGGLILHMLRNYVGDEAFFESLKYYLHKHEYTDVEIDELRMAFEDVIGEDLHWFFDQWFMNAGHPNLEVTKKYNDSTSVLSLTVVQRQDSLYTPMYKLPIDLHIWEKGKKRVEKIWIEKSKNVFNFSCSQKPDLVTFDGKQQLLGIVSYSKSEEELIFQYEHEESYTLKKESILNIVGQSLIESKDQFVADSLYNIEIDDYFNIYLKALRDDFWKIRQIAIQKITPYKGRNKERFIEVIQKIAKNDTKSDVRAEALIYLQIHQDVSKDKFERDFKIALKDSSYKVLGKALLGYAQTNASDRKSVFNQYKDSDKKEIIKSVAEYFIVQKDTLQEKWFFEQYQKNLKPIDQYYFAEQFYEYLKLGSIDKQLQIVEKVYNMKKEKEHIYTRLARYKLFYFIEINKKETEITIVERANQFRQKMMKEEADKTLIDYYTNYFEKKLSIKE